MFLSVEVNWDMTFDLFIKPTKQQTWGDYITNVIDYDYLPPARLRLRINKITM